MKYRMLFTVVIILTALFSFFFSYLYTVHHLQIECDHPHNKIYVTDQFNQTWVYDYNYPGQNHV